MRLSIFIFLLLPYLSFAQKVNKVEHSLDTIKNVENKIDFLNKWISKNYRSKAEASEYYANQIIKLATPLNKYQNIGNAFIQIGLINNKKGKYDVALLNYNKAISNFSLVSDSIGIHRAYNNRGNNYRNNENFSLALEDYHKCLIFFNTVKNHKAISIVNNNIGLVFKQLKNYKKALVYYNKSAKISKEHNLTSSLYLSNTNIANIYSIQNNFKEALSYYKQNLEILEKKPNKYRLSQTYHNIGACFLEMKQYALAIEYQNLSLKLKEEIGNKILIITSLNGLSHANYMMNNFDDALAFCKRAYSLGKEISNIDLQTNSTKEIFKIYAHKNIPDSAIYYFGIHEQLRDSILNKETLKQVSEIQARYEAEKKEAQIALLEKENKNKATQRNGLIIILLLIGGYAGFIVYSYYRNKKLTKLLRIQKTRIERSKEILDKKNQELRHSNQTKNKLFQIISHDLRSPLASVSGISNLIQILTRQGRYHELDETSKDLNDCVTRVLNLTDNLLSWSLNQSGKLPFTPVVIPVKNLLSNILEIYKSAAQQKNILLELSIDQNLFVYADKPMLETVVRNLLNNALKFTSEGGLIIIGAEMVEDHTEIWVEDNGVGISEETIENIFELDNTSSGTRGEKGNGLGLILCKEFIEKNQGEIWVESKENVGTTFRFTIPNAEKIYNEEPISNQ